MRLIVGVVGCTSSLMCGSHWWVKGSPEYWWISHIRNVQYVHGTFFQISGDVSGIRNPFMRLRISYSAKTFNGWQPSNVFAGWLGLTFVTGTWVPSWSDAILIWYHYIIIWTLVTIFNWWLSSKDIKLRVLLKEALVVFHWLTFRIIQLCSLASGHRALFWCKRQLKNYCIYIYIFIYTYIHIYIYTHTHTHTHTHTRISDVKF